MKINLKSKQTIFVVILTLVLAGSYFFIMSHISDNVDKLEKEVKQLSAKYADLQKRSAKKANILKEIKANRVELDRLSTLLPSEIRQEDMILSTNSLVRTSGLQFINLSFAGIKAIAEDVAKTTNNAKSSKNANNAAAKEEGLPDLIGIETEINSNFTCNYEQLKQFMRDVNNNKNMIAIKKLNLKSSEELGISGSMTLKFYGFNDKSQKMGDLNLEVNRGKYNPLLP